MSGWNDLKLEILICILIKSVFFFSRDTLLVESTRVSVPVEHTQWISLRLFHWIHLQMLLLTFVLCFLVQQNNKTGSNQIQLCIYQYIFTRFKKVHFYWPACMSSLWLCWDTKFGGKKKNFLAVIIEVLTSSFTLHSNPIQLDGLAVTAAQGEYSTHKIISKRGSIKLWKLTPIAD